jgi:hypothetical protein
MPGCQRLPIEDIHHRTANPAPFHGIYQRGLVHNRTSRSVEEPGRRLLRPSFAAHNGLLWKDAPRRYDL